MNFRRCWLPAVMTLLLVGPAFGAKKNVVLFVTDDQSPDAGCYGNSVIKTPNLDLLAAESTRFDRAFCTTASCSASRSVILTGMFNHANAQYGHEHTYHHFRTYDRIRSLPVLMAEAGYQTIRVGKFHVGPEPVYHFETALKASSRNPVQMAERVRATLRERSDDRPFFLFFCTSDPHRGGGKASELPYGPDRFGNPRPGQKVAGVTEVRYDPKDVIVPPFLPDTPACRAELAQYYQSVSRIDQGLGVLLQVLKDANVFDDTLFIYTSDHGMAFPGAKTNVYEPAMRVPFVVRNPYEKGAASVSQAMISFVDLTPTILDFAGALPAKSPSHGRSFLSTLGEAHPKDWNEVFASHTFHEITMYYPMRVVRTDRYKLIWNIAHGLPYPFASDLWAAPTWQGVFKQGPDALYGKRTVKDYIHRAKFELYDLKSDPDEIKNLADDSRHAETLAQLKKKLQAFQKRTSDPWELKWRYE
ncbi:MAG: sulfatase [Pirellulales bacterium]